MNPGSWQSLSRPRPTAVALGNFDGVHLGHRRLLEALRAFAESHGLDAVALTFDPHPRAFFVPEQRTVLLTPSAEKAKRISDLGIETVTLAFDAELAVIPAERFAREILIGKLRGEGFFLGPGHRFGKGAAGDANLLRDLAGDPDRVREIPPVLLDGETVSSSSIRHHLKNGEVERANRMLGRPYALRGQVVKGAERGRQIGFPTANLRLDDERKALPAFGVYGGEAHWKGRAVSAVANIGLRPTFAGTKASAIEVHLLGVDENLYGRELEFDLHQFLRPEKTFASVEALRVQITADVAQWSARSGNQGSLR